MTTQRNPETTTAGAFLTEEVATQPDNWVDAATLARSHANLLPQPGERVAVLGCGTSLYVARSIAALREQGGQGVTDAWPGGNPIGLDRDYDRIIAISRSGTTTEILEALQGLRDRTNVTVITADPTTPIVDLGDVISLESVDEKSVVQSRTATTALAMFRWHFGHDLTAAAEQARDVLAEDPSAYDAFIDSDQASFVGMDWAFGLAEEASLKLKEATQSWTESYYMTEYRHGPISIAAPGRIVWALGPWIANLERDARATGALVTGGALDPMAELVRVHRLCILRAAARGLDPDVPRNLTRSIILEG